MHLDWCSVTIPADVDRSCQATAGARRRLWVGQAVWVDSGFGSGRPRIELAYEALGVPMSRLFSEDSGTSADWRTMDYALWDMASKRAPEGNLRLSELPGFGIELDEERLSWAVKANGFELRVTANEAR